MNNKRKNNSGFTLIEVLVALVVLSVGLLGLAGMQTQTQQFSREAYYNTQATFIAHDILERARANPDGISSGFYNDPASALHSNCYSLAGCTPQEIAENDMFEWHGAVADMLPFGDSVICIDSTPDDGTPSSSACDGVGNVYAAKVWWTLVDLSIQRVVTTSAL